MNDTQKPFNAIPEYKDLRKKRIRDNQDVIYDNADLGKLRDSEDFKDKSMGKYNEKVEKQVKNILPPKMSKKKRQQIQKQIQRKEKRDKVLGKGEDNLDVSVVPVAGTFASRIAN